ncbi:cobaltochelatase subunit CobT [Parvularcula sp. ZS-1/3]|uniref:Cobaltochelatase subunit CobT n=1 Tax=Parvularcula mediterranea TaxID=2732508 RepID=A0A7Y3RLX0_9PROT|nr:cobaltochelatase subunit CobT [Parvularcula mediterranea]NNU16429.1 cobaltochelatase subunit CobT [Parvularcula mediterranea]
MDHQESPSERFKRVIASATRAIAAEPDAEVKFGGDQPVVAGNEARLPLPPRRLDKKKVSVSRGQADSAALRLAHHDQALHMQLQPENPEGRALFQLLEDMRCEALGSNALKGIGDNLDAALDRRLEEKGYKRMEDRQDVPVQDIVSLLARERMTGRAVPKSAEKLVDLWREEIENTAGEALDALAEHAAHGDQTAFSDLARSLIEALDLGDKTGEEDTDQKDDEDAPPDENEQPDMDAQSEDDQDTENGGEQPEDQTPDFGEANDGDAEINDDPQQLDEGDPRDDAGDEAPILRRETLGDSGEVYRAYTTEFDQVAHAHELCAPEELARLRNQLDGQLETLHAVVARLANRLHRRLLAQQNRAWQFDLDEGVLDAARLSRVVTDPFQPLSFKQEQEQEFRDTTVTLLLDNSGSMRGRPISVAAICADILARTLERCAVKTEVLGFTTMAWKGGKSREKWVADGRPKHPGRLNDLRHIIYKSASAPWRRTRDNLGLMLKEGLLKENIDGEALLWAHDRLMARPEQRRILMVISDGAPVDDTTSSANGGSYLERHLREVIAQIENRSPIELLAIGIGHDVTRFYRRAITISDVDQLGGAMTEQLAALFEDESRAPRPRRKRA